jgi:hypothetical protein
LPVAARGYTSRKKHARVSDTGVLRETVNECELFHSPRLNKQKFLIFRRVLLFRGIVFYLTARVDRAGVYLMADFPDERQHFLSRFSLDVWAVAMATALVVFIVAGVLPRIPW